MSPVASDRRLAAILFTDIVGYTALMARDEAAGLRVRERHRQLVRPLVESHHGELIEARGDESLSIFPSALDAIRCALAIQERTEGDPELRLHLGIHLGDVVVQAGEVSGDGVNVAARICALSEGGGPCVSGEVYQAVRNQPGIEAVSLGEHELKNVGRPVSVYALTGEVEPHKLSVDRVRDVAEDLELPGMDDLTVPGFSGAPAIAVLPFDNLSGDPEQEHFADGIAEDIITRLSTTPAPVIARNSSFTYKGAPVDVKRVSRELGVRYVVEGSVRRAGERVRISAQLIEATTGRHVWAERYDRDLANLFAVQDEVTEAIVGSVLPGWLRSETDRAARRAPESLGAWESFQRGLWHYIRATKEENERARPFLERAIEQDSSWGPPFAVLAWSHLTDATMLWSDDAAHSVAEGLRAAQTAVSLDDQDPFAYVAMGLAHETTGQPEKAIIAYELAIELSPGFAGTYAMLGQALASQGRPEEGLSQLQKAIRLSPRDPFLFSWLAFGALAHFAAGRHAEAVEWAERSLQRSPNFWIAHMYLAAASTHLGRAEEARAAVGELLRLQPNLTLAGLRSVWQYSESTLVDRFLDGLRKAGLPEE